MAFADYDPKKIVVTLGGTPITGFVDGTFVNFERTNDAFSMTTGADNLTTRTKRNDKSGTLILTLQQTSPSNDLLSTFANLDETASSGVFSLQVKDALGTTVVNSPAAWIRKFAPIERGNEHSPVEWTIDCADSTLVVGSNPVT
jgi:hypothetical protein